MPGAFMEQGFVRAAVLTSVKDREGRYLYVNEPPFQPGPLIERVAARLGGRR